MTLHQGGATRMYELAPEKTQPALLSTFSGDRRFSRFGSVLHLTDLDDDGLGKAGKVTLANANFLHTQWTCVPIRWTSFCHLINSPVVQETIFFLRHPLTYFRFASKLLMQPRLIFNY